MQTPSSLHTPSLLRAGLLPLVAAITFFLGTHCDLAHAANTAPAGITALNEALPTVAGVPTLLTVSGTGDCKYRVGYTRETASSVLQQQWTYSSTAQNPFPMRLKLLDATSPGVYTWVANGVEGCTGSQRLSFTVK